jgi:hypothetical protein
MRIYDEIDRDGDRRISMAEFKQLARQWKAGIVGAQPSREAP